MKQIKLHRSNPFLPNLWAQVDDDDYGWVSLYTWYVYKYNRTTYAKTFIDGKVISMQALILPPPKVGLTVDHNDHNGLNNQRYNLSHRGINYQRRHQQKHKNSTSKYKGVSWNNKKQKWVAQIYACGKQINLGSFQSEIEAAKVYNNALIMYKIDGGIFNVFEEVEGIQ